MWRKRPNHFTFRQINRPDSDRNEYLLINQSEAAAIDVSAACAEAGEILHREKLRLKYLLVTHAHRSHLTALQALKTEFGGV
ncbi:MAG: hypothetical protein P8X90_17790, partial [Desulfobacterales bacterium]